MTETLKTRLMHAERIFLIDGSTLEDRDVYIVNGFLIISADDPDKSPNWYNRDAIIRLENVTQPKPKQQNITRVNYF